MSLSYVCIIEKYVLNNKIYVCVNLLFFLLFCMLNIVKGVYLFNL